MEKQRFWELLAKKKSGDANLEEQLELKQYFLQNGALVEFESQLDEIWNSCFQSGEEISSQHKALAWNSIQQKISSVLPVEQDVAVAYKIPRKPIKLFYKYAVAAAVLIAIISTSWLLMNANQKDEQAKQNIVSTKNGSRSKVQLPDGTQVWLNAGSKLIYDEAYGKKSRNLELEGEAFFDVAHNKEMPLVIKTRHMHVKVLGTAFNLRAYQGDITSEAALIRGSIEVSFPGRPMEKLLLKPQQKITIVNKDTITNAILVNDESVDQEIATPVIAVSPITYNNKDSSVLETSWLNNKLIFRKKELGELSKDIERWFNVTVQIDDSLLASKKFTGTFYNEDIEEALSALQLTYPFHFRFEKNKNTVFIYQ